MMGHFWTTCFLSFLIVLTQCFASNDTQNKVVGGVSMRLVPEPDAEPRPRAFDYEANLERIRAEEGIVQPSEEERLEREKQAREFAERRRAKRARDRLLRRYAWESPAETRSHLWNVSPDEQEGAVAEALLRICISEAAGAEDDCRMIWEVLRNIRSRRCDRARIRRITECEDGVGETMLSAMRRASGWVLGAVPPRTKRQRWVSQLKLSCERPRSFPGTQAMWGRWYGVRCPRTAKLVLGLVDGSDRAHAPTKKARAIAWGGRCEDEGGACDDPIACARGLARIPGLRTKNAFWCLPGTPHCSPTIDPICSKIIVR
jgi:hypothetical protein